MMFKSKPEEVIQDVVARHVQEQIDERVAALVEERLAVVLPALGERLRADVKRAIPSWIRRLPLHSWPELASEWITRYGAGITATIDDNETPTFWKNSAPIPFPAASTRQMVEIMLAQIGEAPFDRAWRTARRNIEDAIGSETHSEFELIVAETLINQGRKATSEEEHQ